MCKKTSSAKRLTALLLALLLLVCNADLGMGLQAYAAETVSKTDGGVVAENYNLSQPEKDLLSSGMLAGKSYSYSAISGGADLITVDTDAKKITAKNEGDWKASRAEIIVSGSVKETVSLTDGAGKFSYTGNAFSVKVTYELKKEIAVATQETLLNTAGWMKQGIANTDAVSGQSGNLYIMEQAMPELVNFAKNGIETSLGTVSFSDELTEIVLDLDAQMKSNGGKFNLSVMIGKYDAGKKTEYLLKNGAAMKTELSNFIAQISELQVALNTMVDNLSMFVDNGWVSADLANQLKTVAGVCSKLIDGLSAANADAWSAAQKGTTLVSSSVDYAKLDTLVAALGTITAAPKVKNPLVLDSTVVQANLSMHNVTVQVVLKTVENKTDSNKLVVYASTDPVKLTIAEGATAAEIKQAVASAGIEADAKAVWSGVYCADHFVTSTTTLPSSLMEDIEYTITYTPKEYTVSYGYTTSAPTTVYYGYKMTLPEHADPEKAYDYKVNSADHAQGEVITITENTKITRSAGKAYSGTNLYSVVADNYGNSSTQAILKSGALKQENGNSRAVQGNVNIRVRKPDPADASSLLVLKDGKLTASAYDADYEDLSWTPYTYGAEGDENKFSGNTVNWTGESAKVKYILYLTNFSKNEVQSILDLAVTLKNDAEKQTEMLDKLASYHTTMGQLDKTKLGALNGVIDVTDFTPDDGTEEDAKNLELREYFKGLISGIIKNNLDTDNKLKVYNMLGEYKTNGLRYYYDNNETVLNEINVLSGYLTGLLADDEKEAALKIMVSAAGYPEYADKIADLEGVMSEVKSALTPPHEMIDLSSPKLGTLISALTAAEQPVNKAANSAYMVSEALTAMDDSKIMIQVMVSISGEHATVTTGVLESGTVVTDQMITDLNSQIKAFTGDVTHYELEVEGDRLESLVGRELTSVINTYYTYSAKEYTVSINGEPYDVISVHDMEIDLPKHEDRGFTYSYTIDGVSGIMTSTYTFTVEQLNRLFKNGSYNITRSVINEMDEKFDAAFSGEGWTIVEDSQGNVVSLKAEIPGNKDGVMNFVTDLIDSGYSHIELNGKPFLYMDENNSTEVSLQTLIDAILEDNSFSSDTLIHLGENGKGQLAASRLSLGNDADEIDVKDLEFVLHLTSAPAQMGTVAEGLKTIQPYIDYQSNNGILDVQLNLPEKAYEVYLTALLASDNVKKGDITAVNSEVALNFLWDYVDVIKDSEATPTTLSNTLEKFGMDVDLSGYDGHYNMVKKLLSLEGVEMELGEDDEFDLEMRLKSKEAIDELLGFFGIDPETDSTYSTYLAMVKEYQNPDEGLVINLDADLKNVGFPYEALIIDFNRLKASNKEDKAEGYTFAKKGAERINAITGESVIILMGDLSGNLTIKGDSILDLNGRTLSGNVTVSNNAQLFIVDSSLNTEKVGEVTGKISGDAVIYGGRYANDAVNELIKDGYTWNEEDGTVSNARYTLSAEDDALNVVLNAEKYREPYAEFIENAVADLAVELILNYYTTAAALSVETGSGSDLELHRVYFDSLIEVLESSTKKADLTQKLLNSINVSNMDDFINQILEDLMDFENMADSAASSGVFASYVMQCAPWAVEITHVLPEDYLSFGITDDTERVKDLTLNLRFGDDSGDMVGFVDALGVVVDDSSYVRVKTEQMTDDAGNHLLRVDGGAEMLVKMDLTKEIEGRYDMVLSTVMGYTTKDPAWAEAANAGDAAKLQTLIDQTSVADFLTAFRNCEKKTFTQMADAVGIERNTQTDKQSQILHDVLTDFGKLLEILQFENDTASLKDYYQNGFYRFQKGKSSRSVESGVGGMFNTLDLAAEVQIKFFCIHSWDKGVETQTATCEQDGIITFTCANCGGKRVQIIPALDHTIVRMEDKVPTCTEMGYENWTYCSVCGNELSKTEIYATGHVKVKTPAVEPTCTRSGWTEGVACSICGETLVVREEIPATGHVEEIVHGYAATCTEEGLSDGAVCAVCDEVLRTQTAIPVADHKDEEPLDHMCDVCGYGPLSECVDNDGDGYCDICGVALGKDHVDNDKDHFCDDCGVRLSWCRDCNRDHDCDICGKTLMRCLDFNHNHICDICWTKISDCEDENGDHRCDYCRRRLSRCADTDNDHLCDVCGKLLSECADLDRDGRCDICGMDLSWVVRLAGDTRAETAREAAEELKAILGVQKFDAIVYTSGYNFPDALTGTYFANEVNAPVLLYYHAESAMNLEYIKNNLSKNGTVYILGGKVAMPEFIEKEIENAGMKVERLGGETRFETNLEILEETGFNGGETVLVCTGYEFADSLSASATGMPILLVNNSFTDLRESQIEYLESLPKKCNFVLIGGTNAISKDLEDVIKKYDTDGKVERVGGATRFETSLMVAEKFFPNAEQAVLAYGWMFPDALCGGTVGYTLNAPVVLASDAKINAVADYIEEYRMVSGYVMGGTVRLTDDVVVKAFDLESADQIHTR